MWAKSSQEKFQDSWWEVVVDTGHVESWEQATELLSAWSLGNTGMALASPIQHLDQAPVHVLKVEAGMQKIAFSGALTLARVPTVPYLLGRDSRFNKWISFSFSVGAL